MSGEKVKQGYLLKYAKGVVTSSWQKVFVELYKDSVLNWYKKKDDKSSKGYVKLINLCEYLTVGSYCRAIPYSPEVPAGNSIENMIAFPQEPDRKSKIHFFLCSSPQEFNDWMAAITSTLPAREPPPTNSQPPPTAAAPPAAAYNAYAPVAPAPTASAPPANVAAIGFENLSISGQPPPYSAAPPYPLYGATPPYPPATGAGAGARPGFVPTPQPYYPPSSTGYPQQPGYPQHAGYSQQPGYAQYPPQQYSQQPYPQQQYQQPYPRQPYPQQPQMYAQQPMQPYVAPSTTVIYQTPQPQTVVIRDHRSHGMGNLAAGMLGGAVAGYAASRMFGGYGYGYGYGHGWGHGSWGSHSWGSGSWGSFSGGSWGSFGGFD